MQSVAPELYLKERFKTGLAVKTTWVDRLVIAGVVALALLVAVAVVFHPRRFWSHHSLAINDYVTQELYPIITQAIASVTALRDTAAQADAELDAAYAIEVAPDARIRLTRASGRSVTESCERRLYGQLVDRFPALEGVAQGDVEAYSVNAFFSEFVAGSGQGSGSVSRLLDECARGGGGADVAEMACGSHLGLLLSMTYDDLRTIANGAVDVGLNERVRIYLARNGSDASDPYLAHIAARAQKGDVDGQAKHAHRAAVLSRALCAVADLRNVCVNVLPQLRALQATRRPMGIIGVFWLFYRPYHESLAQSWDAFKAAFLGRTGTGFRQSMERGVEAHAKWVEGKIFRERFGQRDVDLIKGAVVDVAAGRGTGGVYIGADGRVHRSEGFFKKLGEALKAFALLPTLLTTLITYLPGIFKGVIVVTQALVKYLPPLITELVDATLAIARDPLGFCTRILVSVTGVAYLVVLRLASSMVASSLVYAWAFFYAIPKLILETLMALVFSVVCVVAAVSDLLTNGSLRVLARTENHPEAWWYNTGFEDNNVHVRYLLSYLPCASGYRPARAACVRRDGCGSAACPASMLVRAYRTGRYRHATSLLSGSRLLPSTSKGCRPAVLQASVKCAAALYGGKRAINHKRLDGGAVRDVVRCICLAREHLLPGSRFERNRLAKYATYNDPLSQAIVGSVTDTIDVHDAKPARASTQLGVMVAGIFVMALGLYNMERLRALSGSLVA